MKCRQTMRFLRLPAKYLNRGMIDELTKCLVSKRFIRLKIESGQLSALIEDLRVGYPAVENHNTEAGVRILDTVVGCILEHETSRSPFRLESLNNWLRYWADTTFFVALLEHAIKFPECNEQTWRPFQLSCRRSLASLARRKGDLNRAAEELQNILRDNELYDISLSEYAKTEYEIAMIHFQLGEYETASQTMSQGIAHAELCGDRIGRIINECQLAVIHLVGDLSSPSEVVVRLNHTLKNLRECAARAANDESERDRARHWILNAKLHLFSAAFYAGEVELALPLRQSIESDEWFVRTNTRLRNQLWLAAMDAKIAMLQHDYNTALVEFAQFIPVNLEKWGSSDDRLRTHFQSEDATAELYFLAGRSLQAIAEHLMADRCFDAGMMVNDSKGNVGWKCRIAAAR